MAGHDNGLIVFKLERERPAFSLSNNTLFYIRDKTIRMRDLTSGTDTGVMSVKKLGSQYVQPRSMSYNPAERAVIVTSVSVASSRRGVRARQRSPRSRSHSKRQTTACTSSLLCPRTARLPRAATRPLRASAVRAPAPSSWRGTVWPFSTRPTRWVRECRVERHLDSEAITVEHRHPRP